MTTAPPVLVVDLDGTLLKTDLLVESALKLIKERPAAAIALPSWLLRGKSCLKARIADLVDIDPSSLPYNEEFLEYLRSEHASGRRIWLATASHRKFAAAVAQHVGLFERVLATDDGHNLSGHAKLEALVSELGPKGFDYAGNALVDARIWPQSRRAILVRPDRGVEGLARRQFEVERVFPRRATTLRTWARALRVHQWVKNLLVFVPLLLSHQAQRLDLLLNCTLAFMTFSLVASSAYLLNDLLDLPADRAHPRKKSRPFASGELSPLAGLVVGPGLLVAAGAICLVLPPLFAIALATYLVTSLAYSFRLKQHAMLDVLTLAGLYTLRVVGGAVAMSVMPTFWLLAFSVFIFLCLALVKRYSELMVMQRERKQAASGRGYRVDDLTILSAAGISSGYLSVLVLALYVNSPEIRELYRFPQAIWTLCFLLLYWVSRVWMITHRGDMHDDPIVFTLKDGPSLVIAMLVGLIMVGASL